ncbi:MAG: TolC family protein, partial [Planctomycetes bacterium]|nr:TolC family protein [Planctomycetota bacterium]
MSRNRWIKRALAGALTLSAAGGCKQQLFMEPGDYHDAISKVVLPKSLETDPHSPVVPGVVDKQAQINTVIDFVRPPKNMTLRECLAIALEQGNVGFQSAQGGSNFGFKNDNLDQFSGRLVGGTDAIRAFAVDPAVAQTEIERSLSKFDVRWVTSMQWQKVDQPVAAQFLSFQQSRDAASFSSTLAKPLPTGGVVGITTSMDYSKFSQQAANQTTLVNPNYTPRVQMSIEQPLLRLFGVEVNQLSSIGPLSEGSVVLPGIRPAGGTQSEGILITRIRLDQTKANFEQQVNFMLINVEAAYWNLYAAYYNLYAQEEGLRQAFEGYRFTLIRVLNGSAPPQQLDQIQAQFHRFQGQVYDARGQVLESERQLRGLLGLRSDDGTRVVPIDEPNVAPYKPDFHEAANDAIALRPELMLARQDLKFRQLDLLLQRNLRRPDLRGFATYDIAGLGTRLGGSDFDATSTGLAPGNALANLADNKFNSWTVGFRLDMPLGFRDANGLVRAAQLNLTRSYIQLRDAELKAIEYLSFQYRRVIQTHAVIGPRRAERESLQQYVARIKIVERIVGPDAATFLSNLTVQQQLAAAIAAEARAIADYNTALASFEFAKGTIQQYNNVSIGEGPLPPWVSKRAADHIRERTEAALKVREQPLPPGGTAAGGHPIAPAGGTNSLLNLPPFAEKHDPAPEMSPPRPLTDPKLAPEPRPVPGGAVRPVPGNLTGLPGQPGAAGPFAEPRPAVGVPGVDDAFKPDGRVVIPPPPAG